MPKVYKLLLVVVIVAIAGYFWYVRGVGIKPKPSGSATIEGMTFQWVVKAPMSVPRSEVTATVANGKIYVIGGFDGFAQTSKLVEIYDPSTNSWSRGPDLPQARHHAAAVTIGDIVYIVGGYNGTKWQKHADLFALNKTTNRWDTKAAMPTPRGALAAAMIDNKILAVAGVSNEGLTNVLEVYDPTTDSWEPKKGAPTKRDHLAAAGLAGKFYVSGGRQESLSKNLSSLEIYDPTTDSWTSGPNLPTARGGVAGTNYNNWLVVVGGEQPTSTFDEVEAFDPKTNRWFSLPAIPSARHGLAAATIGNELFVLGGGKNPGLSVSDVNEVLQLITINP